MSSPPSSDTEADQQPNYSWQKNCSCSPPSPTTQRAELNIINTTYTPQHNIFKLIFGGCFSSPVSPTLINGARILYVTPGRFEWAKEMCETYPNCQFECATIGKSFPCPNDLPEKIKPFYWNVQEKLPHPNSTFDFIYCEPLAVYLRTDEWPHYFRELFRTLKPGGFLESQEIDLRGFKLGPTAEIFTTTVSYCLRARGTNPKVGREFPTLLKNTGFTNISKFHVSVPCGWGPPVGIAFGQLLRTKVEHMTPFITNSLGWTEERLKEELDKLYEEQIEFESYCNIHKVYAQKP